MNTIVTIDKAGRVVIPKALRDELGIAPGDSLELTSEGRGMTLAPTEARGRMYKKNGLWVLRGGKGLTHDIVNKVIQDIRDERDRMSRGEEE